MVLENGLLNAKRLLAGNASGQEYTKIVVGTSNTPVSGADTTITGAFEKDITTVDYLDGFVQFNTLLLAGDPAMVIREIGLKNADGVLCHRKVIPDVNKVAGVNYNISYKIKVQ
ncbi:hypothetical protein [Parasegetibacter sp. NRK P23]|uniref:hypothetical protein n=1 Tax=Parasegetibacter sp. NRK P23 TaxID=2942999 RepID=UPI002043B65F|nr:hypothetical protein [Parasegetibacter sp. NRK P23]MCM5528976.1 hypothetical protein [Parasegetibacter sp. NRK P23]